MLLKLFIWLFAVLYVYFVPVCSLIVIISFIIQINLGVFLILYINSTIDISISAIYLLFILNLNFKVNNKIFKTIYIYSFISLLILFVLHAINVNLFFKESIADMLVGLEGIFAFLFIISFYFEVYNLKYNNLKQTLKNLTINFYGFLILTISLFGFKYYLLLNNITKPSFYFLFLTIPISGLIIYFYTKDLQPVITEIKRINNNSDVKVEANGVN